MPFEGFIRVGERSRSCGLDELFQDNLLVLASYSGLTIDQLIGQS